MLKQLSVALTVSMIIGAPAFAACKPACPKGDTCRYDSTKTPKYWCESKDDGGLLDIGKKPLEIQGSGLPQSNGDKLNK